MMDPGNDKQAMRKTIAGRLAALTPEARAAHDASLCKQAESLEELENPRLVMGYMPLPDEINLTPFLRKLLARGILLALPRTDRECNRITAHLVDGIDGCLQSGAYCILEPAPASPQVEIEQINAVLVPGRAFSPKGYRLGRGGGYYDRFLAECPALRIAFCYEEQVVAHLPIADHDLPVDILVTPERVLRNHNSSL
ncbi:MAG: 5-formyltetrahydrofolate cyclo-ligase [Planctomycetes bacterium]|nr:5-formyltetrahydrofolate cyclo-ligase [Planctomycetota bacterium]